MYNGKWKINFIDSKDNEMSFWSIIGKNPVKLYVNETAIITHE